MFKGKNVLVTGGTGLIGRPLVDMLLERGAKVRIASLDDKSRANPSAEFIRADLTRIDTCLSVCKGMDVVFQLVGIKGSPAMAAQKPASFFVPTILFNTNMMTAAYQSGVKKYLFTSSVGVYAPAEVFYEDSVWKTFPSENDRFAGWAKRMGELQAEAFKIEYGWQDVTIVRPANVYGAYDNFDINNAMVIPSLIRRAIDGENPLVVWGDGSPIRDFIHAEDVARGMLIAMENGSGGIYNLGSGEGVTIKQVVDNINATLGGTVKIIWDKTKPAGDKKRLMNVERALAIGFKPKISLLEGITKVIEWYRENKDAVGQRYNVFTEKNIV